MTKYDLADRTARFASDCRTFARRVDKDLCNKEDCKQLVRSSGSVAANYLEADEALSKKDFSMRLKICRKEARESRLWLQLITVSNDLADERHRLADEAYQFVKIFNSILVKSTG